MLNNKNVYRSQQRFKSYNNNVYTEEVNKIVLSTNDDKRLQTYDNIATYPYGTNAFKVCESEILNSKRFVIWNTHKKWSTLMIMLMETMEFHPKLSTIIIGHIFQTIHTEY